MHNLSRPWPKDPYVLAHELHAEWRNIPNYHPIKGKSWIPISYRWNADRGYFLNLVSELCEPDLRILLISAGPDGRNPERVKKALTGKFEDFWHVVVMLRDYWHTLKHDIRKFMPPESRLVVWDSEIDPESWYLIGNRGSPEPPELVLHCCKVTLPNFLPESMVERVYWHKTLNADHMFDDVDSIWGRIGSLMPYQTSGEAAFHGIGITCRPSVLGLIGYEANENRYYHLESTHSQILSQIKAHVINFSRQGSVFDYISSKNNALSMENIE
jgi:hypothetical protein